MVGGGWEMQMCSAAILNLRPLTGRAHSIHWLVGVTAFANIFLSTIVKRV